MAEILLLYLKLPEICCCQTNILNDVETEQMFGGIFYKNKSMGMGYKINVFIALKGSMSNVTRVHLCGKVGSVLDHRSLPPEFESWLAHI